MEVSVMDAILWELENPLAFFKGDLVIPSQSPVLKGLKDSQHVFKL
jgi:hypothetical protein